MVLPTWSSSVRPHGWVLRHSWCECLMKTDSLVPQWNRSTLSLLTWWNETDGAPIISGEFSSHYCRGHFHTPLFPHVSWEQKHKAPLLLDPKPYLAFQYLLSSFLSLSGTLPTPTHPCVSCLSRSTMENFYPTSRLEASSNVLISFSKNTSSPINHSPLSAVIPLLSQRMPHSLGTSAMDRNVTN